MVRSLIVVIIVVAVVVTGTRSFQGGARREGDEEEDSRTASRTLATRVFADVNEITKGCRQEFGARQFGGATLPLPLFLSRSLSISIYGSSLKFLVFFSEHFFLHLSKFIKVKINL